MKNETVCLSFPGKYEYILMVKLAVSAIAVKMNLSIDDIEDIKTASAEGCAILLGLNPRKVKIDIIIDDESLGINMNAKEFSCQKNYIENQINECMALNLPSGCSYTKQGDLVTGISYRKRCG